MSLYITLPFLPYSSFRGDHIVPNFEEIWPSGKGKTATDGDPNKGLNYVKQAMEEGLAGSRNGVFTTVGKPKVCMSVCMSVAPCTCALQFGIASVAH